MTTAQADNVADAEFGGQLPVGRAVGPAGPQLPDFPGSQLGPGMALTGTAVIAAMTRARSRALRNQENRNAGKAQIGNGTVRIWWRLTTSAETGYPQKIAIGSWPISRNGPPMSGVGRTWS